MSDSFTLSSSEDCFCQSHLKSKEFYEILIGFGLLVLFGPGSCLLPEGDLDTQESSGLNSKALKGIRAGSSPKVGQASRLI